MSHENEATFHITGLVVDPRTRHGIQGVRVEAWDKDLLIDDFVGNAVTDGEGRFQIRFGGGFFRELCLDRRPDVFFKVFRGDELIVSTEKAVLWNAKDGEVPVAIAVRLPCGDGEGEVPPEPASVRGRVLGPAQAGIAGLRVTAFDQNVGGEVALGSADTDAGGAWRVAYDLAGARARGKTHADVQVRVASAAGEALAASPVRWNAARDEVIDVTLAPDRVRRPSEYERLTAALGALLGSGDASERMAALREDDDRRDITFLANKSGWDARMVAMAVLALRFAGQAGVEPAYFYALFRAGIPASETALGRLPEDAVRAAWEDAIGREVIPAALRDGIGAALERFRAFAAGGLLDAPPAAGGSPLRDLLTGALGHDEAAKKRFAALYQAHRGDPDTLWSEAARAFGEPAAARLRLDGRLGFLTQNNAPLLERIHGEHAPASIADLVGAGLYRADAWLRLLDGVDVPAGIPGEGGEKRENYAALMAAQLRLSHPTAAIAHQVATGELPLRAERAVKEEVHRFLADPEHGFELGVHPVEAFVRERGAELSPQALGEVKRLQRVHQVTPSDRAMQGLLEHGLHSARDVAQHDREAFVALYAEALGGEGAARETHEKSELVHNAVLNLATSFLLQRGAPPIRALAPAAAPAPEGGGVLAASPAAPAVVQFPTLEGLFGEMDYCACDHCRSVLGPAAYLVDVLNFLDRKLPGMPQTAVDVLLDRRPDIQHLPLTCENTNVALPHVDLVNEVLEHFVVNAALKGDPSLSNFHGHDTGDVPSADLLANPQYVTAGAYDVLRLAVFPLKAPFHQPLESLRLHLEHWEVPLHRAMSILRPDDALERPKTAADPEYGRRDEWMERLGICRQEYRVLTAPDLTLSDLYGLSPSSITPAGVVAMYAKAKPLARVLELSYQELADLLRTEFVNPQSHLVPRLERLGLTLAEIHAVKTGGMSAAQLKARLPQGFDAALYGGDVHAWILAQYDSIKRLILLTDPSGAADPCSFDLLELRYALPDAGTTVLKPVELVRLHRFVRLWRRLGWSLRDTDRAMHALWPAASLPSPADTDLVARQKLDAGFEVLIPRLGNLCRVMDALELKPRKDMVPLLACFAPIDTLHDDSLYRRLFLSPAVLKLDPVFADPGDGAYLSDPNETLDPHRDALRAAFGLTAEEWDVIVGRLQAGGPALPLSLAAASAVFRLSWVGRKLRLGARELLGLIDLSGLDPFAGLDWTPPDPTLPWPRGTADPPILPFLELVRLVRDSGVKVGRLLYLLRHDDPGGKASPPLDAVLDFARRLRGELAAVERDLGSGPAPTAETARARMALVYGDEAAGTFFGLLGGTATYTAAYTQTASGLDPDITAVTNRLGYDPVQMRLSYRGRMTDAVQTQLLAKATGAGTLTAAELAAFTSAVDTLHTQSRALFATQARALFAHYPKLEARLDDFESAGQTLPEWLPTFLDTFLPALRDESKRRQARQAAAAQLRAEPALTDTLLEWEPVLHAATGPGTPASADFLAIEGGGLSARYDLSDASIQLVEVVQGIDFSTGGAALPADPVGLTAAWSGWIEPPAAGAYTFRVDSDAAGTQLEVDGAALPLVAVGGVPSTAPITLRGGKLYRIELTLTGVKDRAALRWEATGLAPETVPAARLYPAIPVERFRDTYLRVGKTLALADALGLDASEVEHAAARFGPAGWLNLLPAHPGAPAADTQALAAAVAALLRYTRVKAERKVRGPALAQALESAALGAAGDGGAALAQLTGWVPADRDALLQRFGLGLADLLQPHHFARVNDALALTRKLGVSAGALAAAVTNQPDAARVGALQAALRARYDADAWRTVLQPVNDALRGRQRDALVACVLHQLRATLPQIDTPDRLYEHLLIDVQMEPCMQTTRVLEKTAAVQLFVQRALLNLEPLVPASTIDAEQWEWTKRYRVWEANRKVFLYPENWLVPAWRDDRSPFFREMESELLQGDVTDDAAAAAVAGYLANLNHVAQLEVCGMCIDEGDARRAEDDVVHVVARPAGAHGAWYYRWLKTGSWAPWEKVGANIEDTPVLPVVWRGRTFLFWLGVMQQMPPQPALPVKNPDAGLTGLKGTDLSTNTKMEVTATLYWSERVKGKWQPARSSDPARPLTLGVFETLGAKAFDRGGLTLSSDVDAEGTLTIDVHYPGGTAQYFKLYNTHALPVRRQDEAPAPSGGLFQWAMVDVGRWRRTFNTAGGAFRVERTGLRFFPGPPAPRVLGNAPLCTVVEPHHPVLDVFRTPFFFQDRRHVFFVRPEQGTVRIDDWRAFGFEAAAADGGSMRLPPVVPSPADPAAGGGGVTETLSGGAGFEFGTRMIGATGSLPARERLPR